MSITHQLSRRRFLKSISKTVLVPSIFGAASFDVSCGSVGRAPAPQATLSDDQLMGALERATGH